MDPSGLPSPPRALRPAPRIWLRALARTSAVLGLLVALVAVIFLAAPAPAAADATATPQELALHELANAARAERGLAPLRFDPALLAIARDRAAAQPLDGPLSHFDTAGALAFVGLLERAAVDYALVGENLARGQDGPEATERLHRGLMDSPPHRANILDPEFDALAVGAVVDPRGRVTFAQLFRAG